MPDETLGSIAITFLSLGGIMLGLTGFEYLMGLVSKKISETRLEKCFIEAHGENFERDLEKMAKFEVLKSIGVKSLFYPHSYEKDILYRYLKKHPQKVEEWNEQFKLHIEGYKARYLAHTNRHRNKKAVEIN